MVNIAIVASGRAQNGAHYRIFDDAYINNAPEENERLRMHASEIAHEILRSIAKRGMEVQRERESKLAP